MTGAHYCMQQKAEEGRRRRAVGKEAAVVEGGVLFDGVLGIRKVRLDGLLAALPAGAQDETMVDSALVELANKAQQDDRTEEQSRVRTHAVWGASSAPRKEPLTGRTVAFAASALVRECLAVAHTAKGVAHPVSAYLVDHTRAAAASRVAVLGRRLIGFSPFFLVP